MVSTKEALNNYIEGSNNKVTMPMGKMLVSAFIAGMFIAIAGLASAAAAVSVGSASIAKLIVAIVFPGGLAMVIFNGTELFTGNNLMIMSVLDKKIKITGMLKNWIAVYIGNLVGSIFFTGLCAVGHVYSMFDNEFAKNVLSTAAMKCNLTFSDAFIKAIFCNMLVCIAVIMAGMAKTIPGKFVGLFLPIMLFVLGGFEHSVANMSYISSGLFANSIYGNLGVNVSGLTWSNFFISNLIPVTLGNIVGGCGIGVAYWYLNIYNNKKK